MLSGLVAVNAWRHFTECSQRKSECSCEKTYVFLPCKEKRFFFFCRAMKFDGIILVMSGLGAEDLIYNWIRVLQVSFIIEASITQSEGV